MPLSDLTLDELVGRALIEEEKDAAGEKVRWEAIDELRHRASRDVYDCAERLASSPSPLERKLGLDILGQLGLERPFREETVAILERTLLADHDVGVRGAALVAFGHLRDERGRPHLLNHASHTAAEIRRSVVWALPWCAFSNEDGELTDQEALAALMDLMEDEDDDVRDWATFAVGQSFEDDTPEVRAALAKRLDDPHDDTREEAIFGLARRRDERAIPPLIELVAGWPGSGALDAAQEMADPRLVEALEAALENGKGQMSRIEAALESCRQAAPPG